MKIRDVTPADAHAIAHLENISYGVYDPDLKLDGHRLQTGERVETAIRVLNERGVVAEENGELKAVALWRPCGDPAKACHLHLLFIHPDRLRKGVGEQFLRMHWERALEEWPTVQVFTLNVLKDGYWSRPFYEKHGYRTYQPGDEARVPGLQEYLDAPRVPGPGGPARSGLVLYYLRAIQMSRP